MTIAELHSKALEHTDIAILKQFNGELEIAIHEFSEAFNFEKEAALLSIKEKIGEPTQSVLLKSAASLAINCQKFREAEKLVSLALSKDPPIDIAEELRSLLEEISFGRHLNIHGTRLDESELQFVIAGKSVGNGLAKSKEIWERLNNFEKLTLRTVERNLGRPFREKGNFDKSIKDRFQPYISVPRAASFAFTIRLGEPTQQLTIPGRNKSTEIIDEIIDNISLLNHSDEEKLKSIIKDDAYFRNFVLLSKELAPDGIDINLVGFTLIRNGQEKKTQLTRTKEDFSLSISEFDSGNATDENEVPHEITGVLSYADSEKHKIKLITDTSTKYYIIVPEGLGDIVRNYWEENVKIKCVKTSKGLKLIDINKM
jgi:hypothetical protein